MLALEVYGVDADMDEQLRAVRRRHGNGVAGLKHHIHRAVRRSNDASFGRLDRNARTENALCERRVGYTFERHDRARSGRCDGDAGITAEQIFQFTKHFAHNLFD